MQKNKYHFLILLIAIEITFSPISYAQVSHIRNQVFIGARPMGMGETFVAVADDGNAIYWNPAGLPFVDRYELQAMHANIFNTDIVNNYLGFLIPDLPYLPYSEKLAFGLDWFNIGFGDDELEYSYNRFTFSTGYRPVKFLSLGCNVKYLNNNASLDGNTKGKASGWGYDLGILVAPWRGLSLGLMAHDISNTRMRYENGVSRTIYFRNIRCGAAYKFPDISFIKRPLLAIDFDDRLHLGAEFWLQNMLGLRAGMQQDLYDHGEKEITLSFGAGIRYKYFQFDYALTNSPMLENTHRFSLSLSFALPPSPVTIKSVKIPDIYASLYMYYQSFPCVISELDYEGEKNLECDIKLKQKKYGINAEKSAEINPQRDESKVIDFSLSLSEAILKLPSNQKYRIQAEVILEPKTFISTKAEKFVTADFNIFGPGTINWANGSNQAVAWMCSNNDSLRSFAAKVCRFGQDIREKVIINDNISKAIKIYNALRLYGISYQRDPNLPYAQSSKAIDKILYPFELLHPQNRVGDCDDTTILYATLLESIGINTALVTTPNHILMMFDSGIHEREKLLACVADNMYVVKNHSIWLPVESTYYCENVNRSFFVAWRKGAEQYKQNQFEPGFEEIFVHQAWQKYEPAYFEKRKIEIPYPALDSILSLYNDDQRVIDEAQNKFLQSLDPNQQCIYYALIGDINKAKKCMEHIFKK